MAIDKLGRPTFFKDTALSLGLGALGGYVIRGRTTPPTIPRADVLRYSMPVLRFAAGAAGAALLLGLVLHLGGRGLSP